MTIQIDKALSDNIDPVLLAAIDELTVTYMARRKGVTPDALRAELETSKSAKASHSRKMVRIVGLMQGPGGFSLLKKQNTKPVAAPSMEQTPYIDFNALLGKSKD